MKNLDFYDVYRVARPLVCLAPYLRQGATLKGFFEAVEAAKTADDFASCVHRFLPTASFRVDRITDTEVRLVHWNWRLDDEYLVAEF